jgi:hypothetical protein
VSRHITGLENMPHYGYDRPTEPQQRRVSTNQYKETYTVKDNFLLQNKEASDHRLNTNTLNSVVQDSARTAL